MAEPETYGADLDTWEKIARVVKIVLAREYPGPGTVKRGRDLDNSRPTVFRGSPTSNISADASGTFNILDTSEATTGDTLSNVYAKAGASTTGVYFIRWVGAIGGRYEVESACESANAIIDLFLAGNPTAGTVDFDFTINSVTETMTFNWDDTAAEVETEMETHSEIGSGDVDVSGGPFPSANIRIEFTGDLANTDILLPSPISWASLTGAEYAWAAHAQRGFA